MQLELPRQQFSFRAQSFLLILTKTALRLTLLQHLDLGSLGGSWSHLAGVDAQSTDVYLKEQGQCGYLLRNTTPLQRTAIRAPPPKYLGKIFLFCFLQGMLSRQLINTLKNALNLFITVEHRKKEEEWRCPVLFFTATLTHTTQSREI